MFCKLFCLRSQRSGRRRCWRQVTEGGDAGDDVLEGGGASGNVPGAELAGEIDMHFTPSSTSPFSLPTTMNALKRHLDEIWVDEIVTPTDLRRQMLRHRSFVIRRPTTSFTPLHQSLLSPSRCSKFISELRDLTQSHSSFA